MFMELWFPNQGYHANLEKEVCVVPNEEKSQMVNNGLRVMCCFMVVS